ncbi:hypothetical protein OSB04_024532, partial [Centaurea solstitialis]
MESPTYPESLPINRKKAIRELTQGQEWTDKLREILQGSENSEFDPASIDGIADQILGMFDNTLSIIGSCSSNKDFQLPTDYAQSTCIVNELNSIIYDEPLPQQTSYLQSFYSLDEQKSMHSSHSLDEHKSTKFDEFFSLQASNLDSSHSVNEQKPKKSDESSRTIMPVKIKGGCYKSCLQLICLSMCRKNSWVSTQVTSVLTDDGHAWRKYGQKKILESKHERCTYKLDQGCLATKQVQMIEEEPPLYKITYTKSHTCKNLQRAPEIILDSRDPGDNSILLNFEAKGLIGNKQVMPLSQTMKVEPKEGSPSLDNWRDNKSTSSNYCLSWDPIAQGSQVSLESLSISEGLDYGSFLWLEHGNMTSLEAYSSMAIMTPLVFLSELYNVFKIKTHAQKAHTDWYSKQLLLRLVKYGGNSRETKNSWVSTQVSSILTDDGHAWRKYGQKKFSSQNMK